MILTASWAIVNGELLRLLCSTHAGYITGQNILIDGGLFPAAF